VIDSAAGLDAEDQVIRRDAAKSVARRGCIHTAEELPDFPRPALEVRAQDRLFVAVGNL
jgi:hypothetical protein